MVSYTRPNGGLDAAIVFRGGERFWAWLGIALAILAHLPLLVLQFQALWGKPHYQIFPLVLLGSACLAWRDGGRLGTLRPGGRIVAAGLLAGLWVLLLVAGLQLSPWLGMVSALGMGLALAFAWGGGRLVRALGPAWVLVGILTPPLHFDRVLVQRLQVTASAGSSRLLDALGVLHLPEGTVIEVADRRLLVEEACSGIQSLFVVLAATLFFAFWRRSPALHTLALVGAAAGWALVGNMARMVFVTWAHTCWGWNLLEGWRHDLVGVLLVVAVLGVLLSTDQLIQGIGSSAAWIVRSVVEAWRCWQWERAREQAFWSDAALAQPLDLAIPPVLLDETAEPTPPTGSPDQPTRLPDLGRTPLRGPWVGVAYGILAVFLLVWLGPVLVLRFAPGRDTLSPRLETLDAERMPPRLRDFERRGFAVERRPRGDEFGEHSRFWTYQFGRHRVTASVDYLFSGWHELTVCYGNLTWSRQERILDTSDPESPISVASFTKGAGTPRHGFLLFQLINSEGDCVAEPEETRSPEGLLARLRRSPIQRRTEEIEASRSRRTYQVQVFVEGSTALTTAERERVREFFRQFLESVRGHLGSGSGSSRAEAGAAS
jgi:exosortase